MLTQRETLKYTEKSKLAVLRICQLTIAPTEGQVGAAPFHRCQAGPKSHVWFWNAPEGLRGCLAFWECPSKKTVQLHCNFLVISFFNV